MNKAILYFFETNNIEKFAIFTYATDSPFFRLHLHLLIAKNKMQSSKYKTEISREPRRKLHSLRSLVEYTRFKTSHDLPASTTSMQKRSFDRLERSLNRDNNLEEQPVAEPIAVIPGFE